MSCERLRRSRQQRRLLLRCPPLLPLLPLIPRLHRLLLPRLLRLLRQRRRPTTVMTTVMTLETTTAMTVATMTEATTTEADTVVMPVRTADDAGRTKERQGLRPLRPFVLPARWRITAWIMLSTLFTMLAVGLIGRSIFLTDVEQSANTEIEQEADEFLRFLDESAGSYTSSTQLLQQYVDRQSVHDDEIILGAVDGAQVAWADGIREQRENSPVFTGATALIRDMLASPDNAGAFAETAVGPVRWGRIDFTDGAETGSLLVMQFTQAQRDAVDQSVATTAWAALAGMLLSAGIAWLVAGQILAPVRSLHRVARDINEHDLTARVPVQGSDDIAAVATTFNQMLDRLEQVYATQQRFVDDAGHELRTPITIVRGHLELLGDDPKERAETLRLVSGELDRMSRIVTDLLVLARAQQPDFVRLAQCDVATLTLDIEAKAQALGERRWQLMEVAEGSVDLDPQRVTQALLQLSANAVQVTNTGDTIRIGSRFIGEGDERRLRLWVKDTGPGVAADDAERIFVRFVRGTMPGDTAGPRRGSGLGLAIVRAITDAHAGSAWVDSIVGEGATFGIDLPAATTDDSLDTALSLEDKEA